MFDCLKKSNVLHSWTTAAGYPAIVLGMPAGHRCGYVQLPDSHPCTGKDCDDHDIKVYGGLTYGNGNVFGFDCAHYGDAKDITIMDKHYRKIYSTYPDWLITLGTIKTTEFCIEECERMAQQFKELENEPNNI